MLAIPRWVIPGLVMDARPLFSEKDKKTPWGFNVKVMAMGGTHTLFTRDRVVFEQVGVGQQVIAHGQFAQNHRGEQELEVQRFEIVEEGDGADEQAKRDKPRTAGKVGAA